MRNKDQRLKLMSDLLKGIKMVKLYAWELPFIRSVQGIRAREIRVLRRLAHIWDGVKGGGQELREATLARICRRIITRELFPRVLSLLKIKFVS